ncbi:thiamine pyrophosphate-dependent enzyme [Actinomadura mexicana]|uniref:2-oxoisovalerate dehydrogenase E1 component n=1 Tax=Actinomadura mexicana TaxID=134959 RepID=A0A239E2D0_9ACTN|nr:thiamine pyrophosphate-dependent enzyme [Actinomadura mexicana]SNS38024.1 2-oxoisovalerate dehydrogenase E1 component [Actinomadura mexicana]
MPEPADVHFLETAATLVPSGAPAPPGGLTGERCLELFDAQLGSRHLDLAARRLRAQGHGFYTIGSSGHEGNAAVAGALRPDDPALLHYRSGAFFLERARQVPGRNPLRDVLLGLVAAAEEPIAGGRHKVFGSRPLNVIPQTSTIASHLPRALGVAFAIERAARLGLDSPWPRDAITVCSFGDASANHSTATGAVNAAVNCGHQGLPLPLLLVCEDNGIGISVRTAPGWIHAAYGSRPGLAYFHADGCDLADAHAVAARAADWVRERRRPAFLHLRTVRLMGHAGSDVESSYRSPAEIASDLDRDPLLRTARLLVDRGVATAKDIVGRYEAKRAEVMALAEQVAGAPRLASAAEVMAPLRYDAPGGGARSAEGEPVTLAQAINRTLGDLLDERPGMLVFGEDVARKGGVYGVTRGLVRRAGAARVFDTILDEQSVLGLALGFGTAGMLPVPEVQYLAYLHNAADQLRGEAATLPFFSSGRYRNPMVVRIAAYAYQKGFGGHFHNDNSVAALRDIPGLVIASPSRPDDAAGMLRACADAAGGEGRVCAMLEPIALYHARDLHEDGDGGWLAPAGGTVPIGRARTYGDGGDLTVVTFANGLRMSLRAARRLEAAGVRCRVVDLRWLAPLPVEDLLREARATGAVLVADETRRTGGVSEGVLTALADAGFRGRAARVTSEDSFIPLGDAAYHVLLSEAAIEEAARRLLTSPR